MTPDEARGYFGIGIYHPKHEVNVGGLLRSAYCFGANFVYTVGRRYKDQASDTPNTPGQIPLFHFKDMEDLKEHLPRSCPLIGVELVEGAEPIQKFYYPRTSAILLGAEDHGLPPKVLEQCHKKVVIPGLRACLNVASTGTIVMYDRQLKQKGV
jgi:tRNA G18 (ribose-2'-O)-methylase SpoU